MASSGTPPWVTELLARNRKVARNISSNSYFLDEVGHKSEESINKMSLGAELKKTSTSTKNGLVQNNQVVNPVPNKGSIGSISGNRERTKLGIGSISLDEHKLQGNTNRGLNTAKAETTTTEKSSSIREQEDRFMEDVENHLHKGKPHLNGIKNGLERNDSILEYGPGIVRKLRSRYQSLALRQYSSRPSLRRSASLENVLDSLDSSSSVGIEMKLESPSPTPPQIEESIYSKRGSKPCGNSNNTNKIMTKSTSLGMEPSFDGAGEGKKNNISNGKGPAPLPPGTRGRGAQQSERKDRMRRARSVDALHRTKYEEEILEKFKAVVLPKEDIVIIEVSKPRANLNLTGLEFNSSTNNNSTAYYLATSNSGTVSSTDKPYPTQLFFASGTENQLNRTRSFASPEHELPPHDIVRETARIFEKNQENLSTKKVGQALRLSKSNLISFVSGNLSTTTSPLSPLPPSQQQQQKGTVMAQESTLIMQETRDKSPSITAKNNNTNANAKQVGIIRPTVSHPTSPLNLTNGDNKVANNKISGDSSRTPPVLSPILHSPSQNQAYKTFLQHSNKPPLSPKPIFTSSPKPNLLTKLVSSHTPAGQPTHATQNSVDRPVIIVKNREHKVISSSPFINNTNNISNISNIAPPVTNGTSKSKSPTPSSPSPLGGDQSKEDGNSYKVPPSGDSSLEGRESPSSVKQGQFSGPLKQTTNGFVVTKSPSFESSSSSPTGGKSNNLKDKAPQQINGLIKSFITSTVPNEPKITKSIPLKASEEPLKSIPKTETVNSEESKPPPVAPRTTSISNSNKKDHGNSDLRAHQKQKSNQSVNSCMVFNFTTRSSVPDYIEDDGLNLNRGSINLAGTVTDESVDDVDSQSNGLKSINVKPIKFDGANVIINGKSSLQKKPKLKKLSISFNEKATTTFEYPSEVSLLAEDEANEKDMLMGHKSPNVINSSGSGLGSYTPKQAKSDYQLGTYVDVDPLATKNNGEVNTKKNNKDEIIEDYLKPDSEDTNWSNEITADILF